MKKLILSLFITSAALAACKKDRTEEDKAPLLQGTWEATKEISSYYENGQLMYRDEDTVPPAQSVLTFAGDSILVYQNGRRTRERLTFSLKGHYLDVYAIDDSLSFRLKWYNNRQMGMVEEETRVSGTGVNLKNEVEVIFVKQ